MMDCKSAELPPVGSKPNFNKRSRTADATKALLKAASFY
jgi:hypothetical protein